MGNSDKVDRVLGIFFRLLNGEGVSVAVMAEYYGVSRKTISRDICYIKNFFVDNCDMTDNAVLKYSHSSKMYHLYMKEDVV